MSKKVINRTECCNVLKLHADRKATNLIHISEINERKLKSLGYQSVQQKLFLCAQCRMHLHRKVSIEKTNEEETPNEQPEASSDNEIDFDEEPDSHNQSSAEETLQEILQNLKNLISETKSASSKKLLLKVLPKHWSQEDIMKNVGYTTTTKRGKR